MWDFLTDPQNQQTLSWIGGGLAVVCSGLWVVLRFVVERNRRGGGAAPPATPAEPSSLLADRGGMAAGRDINIDRRSGMPGGQIVLIVLALAGALVFAVSQAGNQVAVSNGVGVGGNVEGSTITSQ